MAKGSVRKKGKKWYYRFYIEDENGNRVQKEFPGTESKSETEGMLRKAMEDYEAKKVVAKPDNLTIGELLDMWVEEDLKPSNLSNGTVMAYQGNVERIKKHPIADRKLKSVTADHLQAYADQLCFGGKSPDGTPTQPPSKGYLRQFTAVLQRAFKFAVFPKKLLSFNPMEYVVWRWQTEESDLFAEDDDEEATSNVITYEQYIKLTDYLKQKENPALLPIQIAYYTGLRIGEACALTWQDIDLDNQCLTVRRSMRYNGKRHKTEQSKNSLKYGLLYSLNYYKEVREKNRVYYEVYSLPRTEKVPEGYKELSMVCVRPDGAFESSATVSSVCRRARKVMSDLGEFHFHLLRHTFTTNLLTNGAAPKDVQELLGHSDVGTTMNIYAHANRETKRSSARMLDQVVS